MKRVNVRRSITVSALCLSAVVGRVYSQDSQVDEYGDRKATSMLSIGAGFGGGVSMNFEPPKNWKVKPLFSYRAGVDALYPLTPVISASLGLGLESRATKYHWYNDNLLWEIRRVNYFAVTPGFQFSAFYLGVNLGFPMGGARTWQLGDGDREREVELKSDTDSLLFMVEPRIGAVIPVLDDDIGWLGVTIMAGYNTSDLSEKPDFLPAESINRPTVTQTASFQLGVTWQFAIPGTEKRGSKSGEGSK